ncbi:MAG: helix-turn-helix domain-containing protein [Leptolyngbyaceae cyanobacterium]
METPKSDSKLSSASEYALIFGAGASAAMSLAAQQVAAASVPVTALVAIGLMNRRRLDRQLQAGEPLGSLLEEKSTRNGELPEPEVTAQPLPSGQFPAAPPPIEPPPEMLFSEASPPPGPQALMSPHPQMGRPTSRPSSPMRSQVRFSGKQQRLMAAKEALQLAQSESLQQIGAQLQQTRVARGWSLQEVHQRTYIQRYALQAIEQGDVDALPEPFYICAFIQKYAIALGLPGAEIASQFPTA